MLMTLPALLAVPASQAAAAARVTLTLYIERSSVSVAMDQQKWSRVLTAAGFDSHTIRTGSGGKLDITTSGGGGSPVYQVTARLGGRNRIQLPGGASFGLGSTRGLANWVERLKENGPETITHGTTALGLSPRQLEKVQDDLSQVVFSKTAGERPEAVVQKIGKMLAHPLSYGTGADKALAADDPVRDEVKGLSCGTALAAVLRPAGLVLRPRRTGTKLEYLVAKPGDDANLWPVGWPSKGTLRNTVPALLERRQTQAGEFPVADALAELKDQIGVPFLYDHNALARHKIDLAKATVKLKARKTHQASLLRSILFKVKPVPLKHEVRIDEAGKPFLWITTSKK